MPTSKSGKSKKAAPARAVSGQDAKQRAIYHVVRDDEDFETAAEMIYQLVQEAAREHPGKPRVLYLDIDGHRNAAGGWDHDMYELQRHFILGFMSEYLSAIHVPLGSANRSGLSQSDQIVDSHLQLMDPGTESSDPDRLAKRKASMDDLLSGFPGSVGRRYDADDVECGDDSARSRHAEDGPDGVNPQAS